MLMNISLYWTKQLIKVTIYTTTSFTCSLSSDILVTTGLFYSLRKFQISTFWIFLFGVSIQRHFVQRFLDVDVLTLCQPKLKIHLTNFQFVNKRWTSSSFVLLLKRTKRILHYSLFAYMITISSSKATRKRTVCGKTLIMHWRTRTSELTTRLSLKKKEDSVLRHVCRSSAQLSFCKGISKVAEKNGIGAY